MLALLAISAGFALGAAALRLAGPWLAGPPPPGASAGVGAPARAGQAPAGVGAPARAGQAPAGAGAPARAGQAPAGVRAGGGSTGHESEVADAAGARAQAARWSAPAGWALPALAGASAIAAATAGADPSGLAGADVVMKAVLGGAMVLAAARLSPAMLAVPAALAVVSSGRSSAAAVAAGTALGLLLAAGAAGRRDTPLLQALAGAGLAQAALRLAWPDLAGASAVVAALVTLPVLALGLTRLPSRTRRTVVRAAAALVLVAGLAGAAAAGTALSARRTVDAGVQAAQEGLAAAQRAERDTAVDRFSAAAAAFDRAERRLGAWWARPALAVPVAGQHARALRTLARTGADLAASGAAAAREADPDSLRLVDGAFDLDAFAAVLPAVERAGASIERSHAALAGVRSPWLLPTVADPLDRLSDRVDDARRSARTAVLALRTAPDLLGASGPRRWLLAVQTPAEARASGGLMGNYGEVVTEGGRISLSRFGRLGDLNNAGDPTSRTISGPPDFLRRYTPYSPARYWQTVTMSPDFPTVAGVMAELYPQSGGTEIDGVISVDPFVVGAFLELIGQVAVDGWPEPLTAANAAAVLLHDQYVRYPVEVHEQRVDFLGNVTRTLFERLTTGALPAPSAVGSALGPMVSGRHLQLWSARRGEQRFFEHIGASGAVPRLRGDALQVVTQNFNGNKIDWFLHRAYAYEAEVDPSTGAVTSRLEVRLRNDAPAEGLPQGIIGYGGAVVPGQPVTADGENLTLLSVYSPLLLDSFTVDGQAVQASQQNELGRRVYSALVSVPSRTTRTVRLELSGRLTLPPAGEGDGGTEAYRLDVARQPTVNPDDLAVSVTAARREAHPVTGLQRGSGRATASATGVVGDRDRAFVARLEPPTRGLLDRLRRGR